MVSGSDSSLQQCLQALLRFDDNKDKMCDGFPGSQAKHEVPVKMVLTLPARHFCVETAVIEPCCRHCLASVIYACWDQTLYF